MAVRCLRAATQRVRELPHADPVGALLGEALLGHRAESRAKCVDLGGGQVLIVALAGSASGMKMSSRRVCESAGGTTSPARTTAIFRSGSAC